MDVYSDEFSIVNLSYIGLYSDKAEFDKNIYRKKIYGREEYNWEIKYKYTDMFVSCDRELSFRFKKPVTNFYRDLELVIENNPLFEKSLFPINPEKTYPDFIKAMCSAGKKFNVGPMAAVAGAMCDYIAEDMDKDCRCLIIENGGDIFIKNNKDTRVGIYLKDKENGDIAVLKISKDFTPCGLCSSSGTFGHSLSLGKSDLVTVLARDATTADAAATAIGNKINSDQDIPGVIESYKSYNGIKGILICKDRKIGIWGNLELI